MTSSARSPAVPYVVAMLVVGAALLLTRPMWGHAPAVATWPLFLVAVVVSAWLGGVGPGLLAAAASFAAVVFVAFIVGELRAFTWVDAFHVAALVPVGLLIGLLYQGRERARDDLRERDVRLQLVSDQIPGGLWSTDAGLRVTSTFGAQSTLLTGPVTTTLYQHFQTDDRAFAPIAAHLRALAGESSTYELQWRGRTLQSHVEPLRDADGRIIGVVGAATDVTDRKRAEEDVARARQELEDANRAKDRFLATLSHELRTPLTPVLALATALAEQADLPAEVRDELEVIRRNAALEATLIDDLLDVTRIARGKLQLNVTDVDAREMLTNAVEICRPDARDKGVTLDLDEPGGGFAGPRFVRGDAARLQQVFWNLIKNAIKFTPAGGRVTVRWADVTRGDAAGPTRVRVEVADTGIGIGPVVLPRVFDAFEQGTPDITRKFGGLGLGLAITKALVDAHGGNITADSDGPGRGATFAVELDTIAAAVTGGDDDDRNGHPPVRPLDILLVEDHADTARVMKRLLAKAGHRVETAATKRQAIERLSAPTPVDLLISDLGLPDGSGLDVMREAATRRGIKGIALSGFGAEEDVRKSLEAGFCEHLTKPVPMTALRQAIARAAPR